MLRITLAVTPFAALIIWSALSGIPGPEHAMRYRVSRVRSDMRSLATAIESYKIDQSAYPPKRALSIRDSNATSTNEQITIYSTVDRLTTPVAYINSISNDSFSPNESDPFGYIKAENAWLLYSRGPDKVFDLNLIDGSEVWAEKSISDKVIINTYDPTNGYRSTGDIWKVSQQHNRTEDKPANDRQE